MFSFDFFPPQDAYLQFPRVDTDYENQKDDVIRN